MEGGGVKPPLGELRIGWIWEKNYRRLAWEKTYSRAYAKYIGSFFCPKDLLMRSMFGAMIRSLMSFAVFKIGICLISSSVRKSCAVTLLVVIWTPYWINPEERQLSACFVPEHRGSWLTP